MFGSNELIYVAGSPLPIMMEEFEEEEEEEEEVDPPSAPPRSKVARTSLHLLPVDFDCDPLPSSLPIENNSSPEEAEIPKPPHAKPRSKIKSTVTAFDDPVFYAETSKPPETLPRTLKRQKRVKTCVETVPPRVVTPPPRMYATIPRKKHETSQLVSFVN